MSPNGGGRIDRTEQNIERLTGVLERLTTIVQKLTENQIHLDQTLSGLISVTEQHLSALKKAQDQTQKNINTLIKLTRDLIGNR